MTLSGKRALFVLLSVGSVLTDSSANAGQSSRRTRVLFEEVRKITRSAVGSKAAVEQILGLPLVSDAGATNESVHCYRATRKSAEIEKVDLRIDNTGRGELLILDIAPMLKISDDQVSEAFGQPSEIRPETVFVHHVPGDVELRHYLYLDYRINGIKTTFGYLSDRLISITFKK